MPQSDGKTIAISFTEYEAVCAERDDVKAQLADLYERYIRLSNRFDKREAQHERELKKLVEMVKKYFSPQKKEEDDGGG